MNTTLVIAATLAVSSFQQQGRSDPPRDARGIPVVSNPAPVPEGANRSTTDPRNARQSQDQRAVFAPRPSPGNYPPCTREVTDGCIQTYEVGRSPQ